MVQSDKARSENFATIVSPSDCASVFAYRNKIYSGCTSVDHTELWCSTSFNYNGTWRECLRNPVWSSWGSLNSQGLRRRKCLYGSIGTRNCPESGQIDRKYDLIYEGSGK